MSPSQRTTTQIIDFDAFRAEKDRQVVELRIGGEAYEMPATLPAAVALEITRIKGLGGDEAELSIESMNQIGEAVFGTSIWHALLVKHALTFDEIPDILQLVLNVYTSADPNRQTPGARTSGKKRPASAS